MKNLKDFVDSLIAESGLDKMPADFKQEFADRLMIEATKRLGLTAVAELKPEEIVEFEKFVREHEGDANAVIQYLSERIDNFEDKMADALAGFADEVAESAERINKNTA